MNNYQMFRKIQERDNIIKKYSNDTKEDLIDLVIEKDNIIDNLQSKIDKAIEYIEESILDNKIDNVDWDFDDCYYSDMPVARIKPLIDILKF